MFEDNMKIPLRHEMTSQRVATHSSYLQILFRLRLKRLILKQRWTMIHLFCFLIISKIILNTQTLTLRFQYCMTLCISLHDLYCPAAYVKGFPHVTSHCRNLTSTEIDGTWLHHTFLEKFIIHLQVGLKKTKIQGLFTEIYFSIL